MHNKIPINVFFKSNVFEKIVTHTDGENLSEEEFLVDYGTENEANIDLLDHSTLEYTPMDELRVSTSPAQESSISVLYKDKFKKSVK